MENPKAPPKKGKKFIAWKKAINPRTWNVVLVKLEVPGSADRVHVAHEGGKFRVSAARVLGIYSLDRKLLKMQDARSMHDSTFIYTVGRVAKPTNGFSSAYKQCAAGIHCFMRRIDARHY